jgi:hypothetical protein
MLLFKSFLALAASPRGFVERPFKKVLSNSLKKIVRSPYLAQQQKTLRDFPFQVAVG